MGGWEAGEGVKGDQGEGEEESVSSIMAALMRTPVTEEVTKREKRERKYDRDPRVTMDMRHTQV